MSRHKQVKVDREDTVARQLFEKHEELQRQIAETTRYQNHCEQWSKRFAVLPFLGLL